METVSIMITIGGDRAFAITDRQNLILTDGQGKEVLTNFGRATKKRITDLKDHLDRLMVHAQ